MDAIYLFTLRGIPVRASVWFFALIGYYAFALRGQGLEVILAWLVAVTVSILVHEFGHAFVARHFRLSPQVYLHGWGGLCSHDRAQRDRDDALIIAAGPLAGLVFAGVSAGIEAVLPSSALRVPFVYALFEFIWLVSFWWSLVNLLPLFPLDGGQLFRLGLLKLIKPAKKAERIVHLVGVVLAGAAVAWGLTQGSLLIGLLGAMILFQNFSYLNEGSPIAVRRRNELVDQLLADAQAAFGAGDAHEARRLAYQAKDERGVAADQLERAFELIVVGSAALGDWAEALDWSSRAPRTPAVHAARIMALARTGRAAEARLELANPYSAKLDPETRRQLEAELG